MSGSNLEKINQHLLEQNRQLMMQQQILLQQNAQSQQRLNEQSMAAAQLMDSSLNQRSQSSLQLLQDYSNVPIKNPNRRRDNIVTDFSAFESIGPYNSHTVREGSLKALPLGKPYSQI